jgi:hypothetical protein
LLEQTHACVVISRVDAADSVDKRIGYVVQSREMLLNVERARRAGERRVTLARESHDDCGESAVDGARREGV